MMSSQVKGVIFDPMGTLIDSNQAMVLSWKDALEAEGLKAPIEDLWKCVGMGADKLLPIFAGVQKNSLTGNQILKSVYRVFKEKYEKDLKPFPKARELVQKLKQTQVKMACLNSFLSQEELDEILKKARFDDLTNSGCSFVGPVEHSKPEPDSVFQALSQMNLNPSDAIILGSNPYDVDSGIAAGVAVIAFRSGGFSDHHLSGANAIYDDPAHLVKEGMHFELGRSRLVSRRRHSPSRIEPSPKAA